MHHFFLLNAQYPSLQNQHFREISPDRNQHENNFDISFRVILSFL